MKTKKAKLDSEERGVLDSFEQGEWKAVRDSSREKTKLQTYARQTLLKNRRINIRMSSYDLDQIQTMAVREGIPYQTLISSVLHKYAAGYLADKKRS